MRTQSNIASATPLFDADLRIPEHGTEDVVQVNTSFANFGKLK
jgi:hypothetical protein